MQRTVPSSLAGVRGRVRMRLFRSSKGVPYVTLFFASLREAQAFSLARSLRSLKPQRPLRHAFDPYSFPLFLLFSASLRENAFALSHYPSLITHHCFAIPREVSYYVPYLQLPTETDKEPLCSQHKPPGSFLLLVSTEQNRRQAQLAVTYSEEPKASTIVSTSRSRFPIFTR